MSLIKKKTVDIEKKAYIFPDSKVYFEYNMGLSEKILVFILGVIIGMIVGFVFYGIWFVAVVVGLVVGFALIRIRKQQQINKQIATLKKQFKAMLESVATSIGAGRNMISSFNTALIDLKELFSPDAYIVKEVENIISGINNNINIEDLLCDMAERSGIDDIQTFADVFDTCYRKGGDMKEVIGSTYKIINDKMEIDMEIQTMITSAKSELSMMCCMPVVFVIVLNSMGSNITGRGTVSGYISTTIALMIFVAAYYVGRKIMSIKM